MDIETEAGAVVTSADEVVAGGDLPPAPRLDDAAVSGDLVARLAQCEEENRALTSSLRHAAAAAEEMLDEARAEAEEMRAAAMELRDATQRDASAIMDEARLQAAEIVAVAKVDARDALVAERRQLEHDRNDAAASLAQIETDRRELVRLHAELSARLRTLVHAMVDTVDSGGPVGEVGPSSDPAVDFAATVRTGPSVPLRAEDLSSAAAYAAGVQREELRRSDARLEQAFDEFFSSDVEQDSSRRWILED